MRCKIGPYGDKSPRTTGTLGRIACDVFSLSIFDLGVIENETTKPTVILIRLSLGSISLKRTRTEVQTLVLFSVDSVKDLLCEVSSS